MDVCRTVSIYVLNDKNQILMLKHKKLGFWLPPGGKVEDGEPIHQAAQREVKEESGIEIEFIYERIFNSDILDDRAQILPQPLLIQLESKAGEDFIYLARAKDDQIDNKENHEIGWFEFEEALKLDIFENVRKHLRYIQKKFM